MCKQIMVPIRNFLQLSMSLINMTCSLFFLLIIFLPNSSILPDTAILAELQEVGPLLLRPLTGEDLLSYDALADGLNQALSQQLQHHAPSSSPNLLLIALTNYVGALGFSETKFFMAVSPIWNIIMITSMGFSFFHFSVSFLMLLYLICHNKKHPKLLLPLICFTIFLLTMVVTVLLSLMVTMAISLTWEKVKHEYCYTIIIICVVAVFLFAELFLVISEFMQAQRVINMTPVPEQTPSTTQVVGSLSPTMEHDSLESGSYWSTTSPSSAWSGSTNPPTYEQVLANQKSPPVLLSDDPDVPTDKITPFYSMPLSSYIGQSLFPAEVPVFHIHHKPLYFPPKQLYPDPQPYPDHQPYPDSLPIPDHHPYPGPKHHPGPQPYL